VRTYRAPVAEFAVATAVVAGPDPCNLPPGGARIVLCLDGEVNLTCAASAGATALAKGESVFVPHSAGRLTAAGVGHVVCAFVP
jgi:mannose-6-phosphate isomerase